MPFPVDGGMPSFWRSQPDVLDDHRSTETLPETTDIVIIGGGYAGASTAYHCQNLAGNATAPSIVILEARQACSGATGRNGGHIRPDVYNTISAWAAEYGVDAAAEVAAFEVDNLDAVQSFVEKEKIDCDLQVDTVVDAQFDDAYCARNKAGIDLLDANGAQTSSKVDFIPREQTDTATALKHSIGCFRSRAGRLWPYKLVAQLLRRVVSAGGNLQTHTPVSSVSECAHDDGLWTVTTPRGAIRAKWVVFASNAYTSAIAPQYQDRIVPVRGVCSHIVAPKPPTKPLQSSYTFRFSSWDYDYLIPRPDGGVVVGGAKSTFYRELEKWYDNANDSSVIDSAARYFDDYMQRHFHGWEDTGAYAEQVWTGIMGYTADSLPHVGHIPDKNGQLVIAGFNGHGMPQIFLSAQGIARMIVQGAAYEDTGVPRLFKTTPSRLARKMDKTQALEE